MIKNTSIRLNKYYFIWPNQIKKCVSGWFEFLLLVERLQHLRRIGVRDGDGIETFALKVDDEAVGFVVQNALYFCRQNTPQNK